MKTTHIARPIGVSAAVILAIDHLDSSGAMLALDDKRNFYAQANMLSRYTPVPGDYLVLQEGGYEYVNPKDVFERKYAKVTGHVGGGANPHYVPAAGEGKDFSFALEWLKVGKPVARAGWNGKGMFVYMVPANAYPAQTGVARAFFGDGALVPYNAYMAIKGVDGTVNTWVPSISDLLADDWQPVLLTRAGDTLKGGFTGDGVYRETNRMPVHTPKQEREWMGAKITDPRVVGARISTIDHGEDDEQAARRRATERAFSDALLYGTGAYRIDSTGAAEHIPAAQFKAGGGSFDGGGASGDYDRGTSSSSSTASDSCSSSSTSTSSDSGSSSCSSSDSGGGSSGSSD